MRRRVGIGLRAPPKSPLWPAIAERNNLIMLGGDSFGLIGERD
jgi:hypothetical protein